MRTSSNDYEMTTDYETLNGLRYFLYQTAIEYADADIPVETYLRDNESIAKVHNLTDALYAAAHLAYGNFRV